jgi:hypothetical protein
LERAVSMATAIMVHMMSPEIKNYLIFISTFEVDPLSSPLPSFTDILSDPSFLAVVLSNASK